MAFWDDLKQLGKDIGGGLSDLGGELKKIGDETAAEIKQDPKRFLIDSAKDIAVGAAKGATKLGKYILEEGMPDAGFRAMQEMERLHRSGKLPPDRHASYLEGRRKGVTHGQRHLNYLTEKPIPDESNPEQLSTHIRLLEKSYTRLDWFLSLPSLDLDQDDLNNAKDTLLRAKERIRELETKQREIE